MRNPKRTARTAAALMVGVALVAGISVLAASIKARCATSSSKQFTGDFVVSTQQLRLRRAPAHGRRAAQRAARGGGRGRRPARRRPRSTAATPRSASSIRRRPAQLFDLEFVEGSIDDLDDRRISVSKSQRRQRQPRASATPVTVQLLDGKPRDARRCRASTSRTSWPGRTPCRKGLYAQTRRRPVRLLGLHPEERRASPTPRPRPPSARWPRPTRTPRCRAAPSTSTSQAAQIDTFVNLVYGLLALSVIIAVVGIANTLSLSVLRAHPRARPGAGGRSHAARRCARTVRWESVITALLGAVQGIIIGILLGYAVTPGPARPGPRTRSRCPIGALIVVLVHRLRHRRAGGDPPGPPGRQGRRAAGRHRRVARVDGARSRRRSSPGGARRSCGERHRRHAHHAAGRRLAPRRRRSGSRTTPRRALVRIITWSRRR